MANELEGARTLPVKFLDQGDGSTAERVATADQPDILVTKDLTSATAPGDPLNPGTGENIVAVVPGMHLVMFRWVTGGSGTLSFESSLSGGTTWDAILAARLDAGSTNGAISTTSAGSTYVALLPPGTTHVRVRASTFTTGPITTRVGLSASAAVPVVALAAAPALAAGTARIGFSASPGLWQDTSTTVLAAAATFTGTGRDLIAAATNAAWGSSTYAKEYRGMAISDVAGTLYLEVSRDNATFRRIQAVATDNTTTGGLHVARFTYAPTTRYARVVYVNGGTLQTHFTLQEAYLAA